MKIKLLGVAATAALAFSFASSGAQAQSSKFAATYDTDVRLASASTNGGDASCVLIDPDGMPANGDEFTFCTDQDGPYYETEVTSLHVPNWKEILGTMSAQVNLVTFTQAKGKNGAGASTAVAQGTVRAGMLVVPQGSGSVGQCTAAFVAYDANPANNAFSAPGPITFASRRQELSVDVDLSLVDLDLLDEVTADDLGITGSVTVALGLDTTAAHSFQFIEADLTSGWYDIVACYDFTAIASVSGADIDEDTIASSMAALGPRIITVQQVRATNDGIIDESN